MRGVTFFVGIAGAMLLALTLHIRTEAEADVSAMRSLVKVYQREIAGLRKDRDKARAELHAKPFETKVYTAYFPCQAQPRPLPRVTPIFSRDSQLYATGGF